MSVIEKAIDTLTGRKVNKTALDLNDAVKKATEKIDAERSKKEAEERQAAHAAKE